MGPGIPVDPTKATEKDIFPEAGSEAAAEEAESVPA
jgi:hypothetical protein